MLIGVRAKNHRQQVKARGARDDVDDRRTLPEIWDPLHAEFNFTLDAAANKENAKLPFFYSMKNCGLRNSWMGERVWCNPPFSDLKSWVGKALHEVWNCGCPLAVLLLPNNRAEQGFWQDLIEPYRDGRSKGPVKITTRFLKGRPRFGFPATRERPVKGDRPPFGLCLVIFERNEEFGKEFSNADSTRK